MMSGETKNEIKKQLVKDCLKKIIGYPIKICLVVSKNEDENTDFNGYLIRHEVRGKPLLGIRFYTETEAIALDYVAFSESIFKIVEKNQNPSPLMADYPFSENFLKKEFLRQKEENEIYDQRKNKK